MSRSTLSNSKISAKEVRLSYGVGTSTWSTWMKPLRKVIPLYTKVYSPKQLEAIYKKLGRPD